MNKKNLFGMIPLIAGGILAMFVTACPNPAGSDSSSNPSTGTSPTITGTSPTITVTVTERYNTVPYIPPSTGAKSGEAVADVPGGTVPGTDGGATDVPGGTVPGTDVPAAETYRLIYSAKDPEKNYYVYLLGHVNEVPIVYRQAVIYNGTTPITIGYSKSTATETVITESVEKAFSNTVSSSSMHGWEVKVNTEFNIGPVKVGVEATGKGEYTSGEEETRSTSNTYETAVSKSTEESDSIEITIGSYNEPAGKYRYSLFGTVDVYYVLITDSGKTTVEGSYATFCARPRSYAWGIDYEPNMAGSFSKTAPGELLELPAVTLAALPAPVDEYDENLIPPPPVAKKPVAEPAGGSYNAEQTVALSCPDDGSAVYYTTDGSTPTKSSTPYTYPIQVKEGTTVIKAFAVKDGYNDSPLMDEAYTVTIPAAIAEWSEKRTNNRTVDDGDNYKLDYYTSNLGLERLKVDGYKWVKIIINFDTQAIDYADAYLQLYKGHGMGQKYGGAWEETWLSKKWKNWTKTVEIPIEDFNNEFTAKYYADGAGSDRWTLGTRTATVKALK